MPNVFILGTGMAGCGAAHRFHAEGITPVMYDKNAYPGGHTASFEDDGFIFDQGPHISFTKDSRIQELFADSVDQVYETMQLNANNYWRGYWPQHPVQLHMHGLPEDVIVKAISDFVEERQAPERPVRNYADWLLASFGRTFADAIHAEISPDYGRQHEHRLAGAPHLPAEPRRGAARSDLAFCADHPLHQPFPVSQRGRICLVFEEVLSAGKSNTESRADHD
jgi:phytoene dehydrogenase-like protein